MPRAKGLVSVGILLILTILVISQVQAATIQGKIYSPDLELAKKSLVNINSTPRQNLVSSDGTYSFIVPQGTYNIEAFCTIQGVLLYANETITVPQEGTFVLDLILFDTPDIEDIDFDETELKMIENLLEQRKVNNLWFVIVAIVAGIILVIIFTYFLIRKFRKKHQQKVKAKLSRKHKKFKAKAVKLVEEKPVGDEVMNRILDILKREKRVTQKDIRKELKISEAKASLIIADLESQGKVKKIKRGRGNIIIYQE